MSKIHITISNANYGVIISDGAIAVVFSKFIRRFTKFSMVYNARIKEYIPQISNRYYGYCGRNKEYRLPISTLPALSNALRENRVLRDDICVVYDKDYLTVPLDVELRELPFELAEYQHTYINIASDSEPIRFIDLEPGKGKTTIATRALAAVNLRTAIVVIPNYIEKWSSELGKYYNIEESEYIVIRGNESLKQLMSMTAIPYKFIIFSMRTLMNYITAYEEDEAFDTGMIPPQYLMQHLGVGTVFNDEAHQEFYSLYKIMCYFDAKKFIAQTATLNNLQKDIEFYYYTLFPEESRIKGIVEFPPHIDVMPVRYFINGNYRLNFRRAQGYNHILYEQSIMKYNKLLTAYVKMIIKYLDDKYISRRVDGEKALIFASSIALCRYICSEIKKVYPKLNVTTYVEKDPQINLYNSDICVTTPAGGGTAHDIAGLITVINTVSLISIQKNQQNPNRLREIPGREVWYVYFYTPKIPNHRDMHVKRMDAMRKYTKKFVHDTYNITA